MWIDFNGGNGGGGVTPSDVEQMIENKQNLYTASTLSDITNPKEGDVACIITTASSSTSSWENISVDNLAEDMEAETFWGRTFKFSCDTSVGFDWSLTVNLEDGGGNQLFYGVDCVTDPETADIWYEYWSGDTPENWNAGEQDVTITFPEDDGTLTFVAANIINIEELAQEGILSVQEYVETTTSSSTQYSYINGQWVELASKDYVNNVVGDIETALASI